MNRRSFIALLGGAAAGWPLAVGSAEGRPRVAFLTLNGPQQGAPLIPAFVDGLRRLGYVEGRNVDVDYRYAAGDVERLRPLVQELIALKPEVLVSTEPSSARALKGLAPALPIVCFALTDALIPDLIASYARPGGNVTGLAQSVEGVTGKLVELALEVVPGAARIGFLSNPMGASMPLFAQSIDTAARARGITVQTEEVTAASELTVAFDRFGRQGVQAVIVPVNGLFGVQRAHTASCAPCQWNERSLHVCRPSPPRANIWRLACSHPMVSTAASSIGVAPAMSAGF